MNTNIMRVPMLNGGHSRKVLIDTGPSLSMVNRSIVENGEILIGRTVQARSYDGTTKV